CASGSLYYSGNSPPYGFDSW
nr:immunoglobulin heavy chain junction region [Macaca mulatta]